MKRLLLTTLLFMIVVWGVRADQPRVRKRTEVFAVKEGAELKLDIYDVPQDGERPCLVFMFGGGFFSGQRDGEYYVPFFQRMAREGYVVVSIDYRLGFKQFAESGGADQEGGVKRFLDIFQNTIMIAVEDLFDATRYILDNSGSLGIDPSMIITSGSSAGAISVLQGDYELANQTETASRLPGDFRYAGVISCAGAIYSTNGHLEWKRPPAPTLMFHGDADRNVPYSKIRLFRYGFFGSEYIAERFDKNGFPYYFYSEENGTHQLAATPLYDNLEEIDSFLRKYVRERKPLKATVRVRNLDKPVQEKNFGIGTYIRTNFGQ